MKHFIDTAFLLRGNSVACGAEPDKIDEYFEDEIPKSKCSGCNALTDRLFPDPDGDERYNFCGRCIREME